ncbi:TetR/AcrR family transcriptional regulator [Paenibacillus nasutitermitis]|uniref:HTH-type transcriptional regulator PksA n=1 Tax=Paenibacillus nasutitermitis TaxID=1652958 RepID=A0A916ZGE0_9BACL|nr:TetR family transcriptional regulator C-terminal domain-containing protein [Paenibacillus nasutitermitis]GGD96184.1 HTH-type transcriptional regulator PksA [Paenibacillus nasutitermitis]
MPKIVDHQQRKENIAEAAWRVIRREGMDGVSVRRIAQEMGISLGSLRHYFDNQSELLAFSMRLASQRVHARIRNLPFSGDIRHDIEQVIAQLLPLDEERRSEAEIWLAFAGKAISDSEIRIMSQDIHDELRAGFRLIIDQLTASKLTPSAIDAEYEAGRLHALVDGLVVHHTVYPDRVNKSDMISIVSRHLDSLLAASPRQ